ncbi:unnamed protein product [Tuber melanosporum]|uniref:(Perigord truffle) hypothetical protein n=1 Tax=Tuber melanosporum (strain Mel28) TaxID=656061 RepID=D5GLW1_TUBMM|nr:uncharacterized protein GSTUM_00010442001 [Tuber melanosporum]CAZ85528.1 unnamed protein product [Tuber melanosporum]
MVRLAAATLEPRPRSSDQKQHQGSSGRQYARSPIPLPSPATPSHRFPIHPPSHRRNFTIFIPDTPAIPTPIIYCPPSRQPSRGICRFTVRKLLNHSRCHNELLSVVDNTYSVSAEGEGADDKGLGEEYRGERTDGEKTGCSRLPRHRATDIGTYKIYPRSCSDSGSSSCAPSSR